MAYHACMLYNIIYIIWSWTVSWGAHKQPCSYWRTLVLWRWHGWVSMSLNFPKGVKHSSKTIGPRTLFVGTYSLSPLLSNEWAQKNHWKMTALFLFLFGTVQPYLRSRHLNAWTPLGASPIPDRHAMEIIGMCFHLTPCFYLAKSSQGVPGRLLRIPLRSRLFCYRSRHLAQKAPKLRTRDRVWETGGQLFT